MRRIPGWSTLVLILAASVPIAGEPRPPDTESAARDVELALLILRTTLEEVTLEDPDVESRDSNKSPVKLEFRDVRPQSIGADTEMVGPNTLELTCGGLVGSEAHLLQRGAHVCLYARPKAGKVQLCDLHRWYMASDPDCDSPFSSKLSLFCMASDDSCPRDDDPEAEEPERESYLWSGPTVQEAAASQARNLGLNFHESAGGYLQTGEALVGREPRARAMADLNGDGLQDVVVAPAGVSTVEVYLSKRNSPPERVALFELELEACSLEIRDFGAGPAVDVVVTHCASVEAPQGAWTVLIGNGEGQFEMDKLLQPVGK